MFKILRIETKQYFKDPLVYGFFVLPIILLITFSIVFDLPTSLSSTLFIQTLFISLFIYGNKIMLYRNETIYKKINNSRIKWRQIIAALIIINIIFIMLTMMLPMIIVLTKTHSAAWMEENQYWFFLNADNVNISTETAVNTNEVLKSGLTTNLLLLNSTMATFAQFLFAYFIINFISMSFAHLLAISSKNQIKYFSLAITLSLIIILVSDIFSKDMYVMTDGAYTQDSLMINNGLWQIIKKINPFYWSNQLLMNTIVADQFSGTYTALETPAIYDYDGITITLNYYWTPSYYNVFHVGTTADPNVNLYRPVVIENCEMTQLLTLFVPIITPLSFTAWSLLVTEVKG